MKTKIDLLSKSGLFYLKAFILTSLFIIALLCLSYAEIDMEAIKHIESRGNPLAYNKHSQARGLYQITPICLKEYNIYNNTDYSLNDLFNPNINKEIAKWYLTKRIPQLLRHYGIPINTLTVIASYNWGIGEIKRWYKSGANFDKLPRETRRYYVRYVQA